MRSPSKVTQATSATITVRKARLVWIVPRPIAAVMTRLRQQVAERSAKGSCQNVSEPEGEDRVDAERIEDRNECDQRAKRDNAELEAESERFRRQITAAVPSAKVKRMADQ